MRKTPAALAATAALVLPTTNAWAAATAKTKVVTKKRSFTGSLASAQQYGDVEVTIVVKKTTRTNLKTHKKTVKRRITAVHVPIYPNHTDRSIFINQNALPILIQETLSAQKASINMVSGATLTSQAFEQSLQAAIHKEKAW